MPSPSDSLMFCLPFRRVHSTCPFGDVENPNPMCYRHTHADKLNSGTSLEESKTQLHVLQALHILQREGKQKHNNNKLKKDALMKFWRNSTSILDASAWVVKLVCPS